MSDLVFPAFAPPHWSWTYPLKKMPSFNTTVQTPTSARGELRIANQTFPIWKFNYDISYLKGDAQHGSDSAWQTLLGFFMAVQGAADDWLFNDPYDNTVPTSAPQVIGTGDGVTTDFLMYRSFGSLGGVDIIQNFQSAPVIYVNGGAVSSSTYSLDEYGNLTFNTAPTSGYVIAWSGQFYFRCRFLDDEWGDLEETFYQCWALSELKFKSVIL